MRADAVGHLMDRYLGRTETFVYTLLRHQTEFRPVVLAKLTENLDEFPFEPIHEVRPTGASFAGRVGRRLAAKAQGFPNTYDYVYTKNLAAAARESGCVLLHAHFGQVALANLYAARRIEMPLVASFYGWDIPAAAGPPYDALFEAARRFVCEGPVLAERLSTVGCPIDKISVVRIGIDLDRFELTERTRSQPLIVLQTSRFVEKKGLDLSIRAFAQASRQLPQAAELWLVGDGPLRGDLEALATSLGIARSVKFLGMMTHDEYRAVSRRAHVGINPSRTARDGDTEGGAPTVLLEMQASGIPIVATRHADIPYVVPDPERLVPEEDVGALAERLVELATISDGEYQARVAEARAFVADRHDANVVAHQLADVYRDVVA